jgi:hypothetical protein
MKMEEEVHGNTEYDDEVNIMKKKAIAFRSIYTPKPHIGSNIRNKKTVPPRKTSNPRPSNPVHSTPYAYSSPALQGHI